MGRRARDTGPVGRRRDDLGSWNRDSDCGPGAHLRPLLPDLRRRLGANPGRRARVESREAHRRGAWRSRQRRERAWPGKRVHSQPAGCSVKRLLLIEDEPGLVLTLTDRLSREGYELESTADGESGVERATNEAFDLLLLDVMLPRMNGFDVCRELRKRGVLTPVIMLTARGQVTDKVAGLKLGADDYVTKPFEMTELLARLEAHLRRAPSAPHPAGGYAFGDVRV